MRIHGGGDGHDLDLERLISWEAPTGMSRRDDLPTTAHRTRERTARDWILLDKFRIMI